MSKQVVHYIPCGYDAIVVGKSAFLYCVVDHPKFPVTVENGRALSTSVVLSINGDEFETLSTIYKPKGEV